MLLPQLHKPWSWFITGGYLVKRWFLPAAARARGQSNDLNREILASNLFNCCKEVINAPPVPSISRCIHIVYRHKNVWEYQWSNFIYNCMSTFLHYVHCKYALLDCSAPGGERCESLTRVDEIGDRNPVAEEMSLQWRYNERDGVSNHQPHDCLLNCLFRRRSKKRPKLRVTGLVRGIHRWPENSSHKRPVTRKMFPFDDVIMVLLKARIVPPSVHVLEKGPAHWRKTHCTHNQPPIPPWSAVGRPPMGCGSPANTSRDNDVVITSQRRHFDVITSKWRRFDVITTLLLRHVFSGSQRSTNITASLQHQLPLE